MLPLSARPSSRHLLAKRPRSAPASRRGRLRGRRGLHRPPQGINLRPQQVARGPLFVAGAVYLFLGVAAAVISRQRAALLTARSDLNETLKEGGRSGGAFFRHHRRWGDMRP